MFDQVFREHAEAIADKRILTSTRVHDLARAGSDDYKGAIITDALPRDVFEEIARLTTSDLDQMAYKFAKIDQNTGETLFTPEQSAILSPNTKAAISKISRAFNQACHHESHFTIIENYGTKAAADSGFHIDTGNPWKTRLERALIAVSSDIEDQDHETELLMTDNLSDAALKQFIRNKTPYNELPDYMKEHIRIMRSGDLCFNKSLGDEYDNARQDAVYHRGPAHKNNFIEIGKSRKNLVWEKIIPMELDAA